MRRRTPFTRVKPPNKFFNFKEVTPPQNKRQTASLCLSVSVCVCVEAHWDWEATATAAHVTARRKKAQHAAKHMASVMENGK